MSVDFPEPDGPMMATNSPSSMRSDTPQRGDLELAVPVDLADVDQLDDGRRHVVSGWHTITHPRRS